MSPRVCLALLSAFSVYCAAGIALYRSFLRHLEKNSKAEYIDIQNDWRARLFVRTLFFVFWWLIVTVGGAIFICAGLQEEFLCEFPSYRRLSSRFKKYEAPPPSKYAVMTNDEMKTIVRRLLSDTDYRIRKENRWAAV